MPKPLATTSSLLFWLWLPWLPACSQEAPSQAMAEPGTLRALQDPNAIVPVVKNILFVEEVRRHSPSDPIHHEPLAADLSVVYAADGERTMAFLLESNLRALALPPAELRARALGNLRTKLPFLERRGSGPLYMLVAGGTFESSLLLLDDVWQDQSAHVQGDLVVGVPTRDLVYFTGSESPEGLGKLRQAVAHFAHETSHAVTQQLLRRVDGRWVAFE